jgi:hypothetical protein
VKEAPHLESVSGLADLHALAVLGTCMAGKLPDISDVAGVAGSLRKLEIEDCSGIEAPDDLKRLVNRRFLGDSDIESLSPLRNLAHLEMFHAWGSTHVVDGDLTALAQART